MARTAPMGFTGKVFQCNTGVICIFCPPDSVMKPNTGFEDAVEAVLKNIRSKECGRILMDAVAQAPHPTFIVPQTHGNGPGTVAYWNNLATLRHEPLRTCNRGGNGQAAGAVIPGGGMGEGGGSAVAIYFTPGLNRGGVQPGSQQDEVLLHELVHAHRKLSGRQTCRPVPHGMDTIEELFSITVTNIYSSHYGRKLRRDHHGFQEITDPAGWIKQFQSELRDLAKEEALVVQELRPRAERGFWPFS